MFVLMRALISVLALFASAIACAAELYFPSSGENWESVAPERVGWDAQAVSDALYVVGELNSSGMVIVHNGRIMAERYWDEPEDARYRRSLNGFDEQQRAIEDVASAQKSVVAILAGMAQARGYLELDDAVSTYLGAGWSKATADQEHAITLRHLLIMSSGLSTDFSYVAAPGTVWLYNTPVYHATMRVLMAATGLERNGLTKGWLSDPIGASNTAWTPRPGFDAAIAVGLSTTARDLARFGLMIQAGGKWGDDIVLEDTYFLADMLSPSQTVNPAYGYLWWINGQEFALGPDSNATRSEGKLIPAAPDDLVAMQGAGDRKLYLVPSLKLVVSRLGFYGDKDGVSFNDAFWTALMRAVPK